MAETGAGARIMEGLGMTPDELMALLSQNKSGNDTAELHRQLERRLLSFLDRRAIDTDTLAALLAAYTLLILTGATGNGLVCLAVARRPKMRTARNLLIVNLAAADLLLCLFTMPFSLVEIALKIWPLGGTTCKLVAGLQATSVFVSTLSITAIAIDRYLVIVYPTKQHWCFSALVGMPLIWLLALLLSVPMFMYRVLDHIELPDPARGTVVHLEYCVEHWPVEEGPLLLLHLLNRVPPRLGPLNQSAPRQQHDKRRMHRTNVLLVAIAAIFAASWLPLHILNLVADSTPSLTADSRLYRVYFACCHMAGMSSACSNPLLYGWLNDNFRREFRRILSTCCPRLRTRRASATGPPSESRPLTGQALVLFRRQQRPHTQDTCVEAAPPQPAEDQYETLVVLSQP
ncbi:hypothetical protein MRX96_006935 [Rhipicephalus microplus]